MKQAQATRSSPAVTFNDGIAIYASSPEGFLVNSFIVETANGLILIDTQFLVSPAKEVRSIIDSIGQPLLAVIITHPHPDHFGGAAVILDGLKNIPIYATQPTFDGIKTTESAKREFWTPIYREEYPTSTLLPDKIVRSGETITIDTIEILIDDLGAGESSDITVLYFTQSDQLIVSDLVYNKVHPWLAEGRSQAWLDQIALVKKRYPQAKRVFAGHGKDGTLTMLDEQAEYITTFRKLVMEARQNGVVSDADKERIIAKTKALYPSYGMENLIGFNIDGIAKE